MNGVASMNAQWGAFLASQKGQNALQWVQAALLAAIAMMLFIGLAPVLSAGSDDTFAEIVTTLINFMQGSLGKAISLIGLLVAVIAAIGGNTRAGLIVIFVLVLLNFGPNLIEGWFTASF